MTEIRGWHVATGFGAAFGLIIAVNVTLAVQAVRTFPGLEVKNSYVASQSFDADRAAQMALGWDVAARLEDGTLRLEVRADGRAVAPEIVEATFGRPTSTASDQSPDFVFDGSAFAAPIAAAPGNWDLWIALRAEDGTMFRQRLTVVVPR